MTLKMAIWPVLPYVQQTNHKKGLWGATFFLIPRQAGSLDHHRPVARDEWNEPTQTHPELTLIFYTLSLLSH